MKVNEKLQSLRKLTDEELNTKIKASKEELFSLRLKQSTGTLEKPNKIHELRKDIARMKTILSERKIGGEK